MTIRFTLSIEDSVDLQRHFLKSDHKYRRSVWILRLFIPALSMLLLLLDAIGGTLRISTSLFYIVIGTVWFAFLPTWSLRNILRRARRSFAKPENSIYFGATELTLDDATITAQCAGHKTHYTWSQILKAEESATHLFIYQSPLSAFIIPKEQLSMEECTTLRKFVAAHTSLQPQSPVNGSN